MTKKETLFQARYGVAQAPSIIAHDIVELLLSHKSARHFLPNVVGDDVLATLVAAAQSASTSSNLQAWSVVAVRDESRKKRLAALAGDQKYIFEAPLFLVWVADLSRAERMAQSVQKQLEGADYLESFLLAVIDAALAAQNAAIAAEALGLGICYIGALRNHPDEIAKELQLPEKSFAVFGMCVGYEAETSSSTLRPRLPQDVVLHHEVYNFMKEQAGLEQYEQVQKHHQEQQGMRAVGYRSRVVDRLIKAEALHGREHLRKTLQKLGFQLK